MRPDRCALCIESLVFTFLFGKIPFINSWNLVSTSRSALVVLAFFGLEIINDHGGPIFME